ncbi:hypothetical protein CYMTET_9507 [Cymbomonas tetramitiformis]|uniref:Uncharacterized protein n=1 Tax=Cymbomonas tetramitiformis TaxID=36881 RepID=A0AAE0GRD3_9CHLO|nr:hypothetical protein CYMTET_9507 [Cymbomonas tetramitiformis]
MINVNYDFLPTKFESWKRAADLDRNVYAASSTSSSSQTPSVRRLCGPIPSDDSEDSTGSSQSLPPSIVSVSTPRELAAAPKLVVSPGDGSLFVVHVASGSVETSQIDETWSAVDIATVEGFGRMPLVVTKAWIAAESDTILHCVAWRPITTQSAQDKSKQGAYVEIFVLTIDLQPLSQTTAGDDRKDSDPVTPLKVVAVHSIAKAAGPPSMVAVDSRSSTAFMVAEVISTAASSGCDFEQGKSITAIENERAGVGVAGGVDILGYDDDEDDDDAMDDSPQISGGWSGCGGLVDGETAELELFQMQCYAMGACRVGPHGRIGKVALAADPGNFLTSGASPLLGLAHDVHCVLGEVRSASSASDPPEIEHVGNMPALAYVLRGRPRTLYLHMVRGAGHAPVAAVVQDDGLVAVYEAPSSADALHGRHNVLQPSLQPHAPQEVPVTVLGAPLPECIGDDETIALTPQQSLTHPALHATRAVAAAAEAAPPSGSGAVSFGSFRDIDQRASEKGQPPSPGEKRSGKPTLPPSPPRISKKGKATEQGAHGDEDIAGLEDENRWDHAEGLDAEILDACI